MKNTKVKLVAFGSFFLLIALAFYVSGSPQFNRDLKHDAYHLDTIKNAREAIDGFYNTKKILPKSIADIVNFSIELDRKTDHMSYVQFHNLRQFVAQSKEDLFQMRYQKITDTDYQLCSYFIHDWETADAHNASRSDEYWKHPAGDYCFVFSINKEPPSPNFEDKGVAEKWVSARQHK